MTLTSEGHCTADSVQSVTRVPVYNAALKRNELSDAAQSKLWIERWTGPGGAKYLAWTRNLREWLLYFDFKSSVHGYCTPSSLIEIILYLHSITAFKTNDLFVFHQVYVLIVL